MGMKLLAVIMELSPVEAAKSSLKELLKVKGLAHPLLFPYLLERGTNFPGPRIISSQGQGHWHGPLKESKSLKKQVFIFVGPLASIALVV